jgi:hypothetical protein
MIRELSNLFSDAFQHLFLFGRGRGEVHPLRDLFHFFFFHAARGDGRGAQTNARGVKRFSGVKRGSYFC